MTPLTPKKLAQIQARLASEGLVEGDAQRIPLRSADSPAPLTSGQERLWFLESLAPGSPVFLIPAAYTLTGSLDVPRLERALARVLARHESLRTCFPSEGGRVVPRVEEDVPAEIELRGCDGESRERRRAEALLNARARARDALDLRSAPLLRLTLFRVDDDEHVLLVVLHHVVGEVQSLGVLVRDLAAEYRADGADAGLPALPIQFGDFAAWQRAELESERGAEQLAWWTGKLAGELPTLQLPTDRPRPAVQTFAGGTRTRSLPDELVRRVRALARAEKVTPFSVALTAYATLLARIAGAEELLVGVPTTDRTRAEVRDLIGFFVNTLVLRADLTGTPDFRSALARVHEFHLGAQSNAGVAFEHLVERLGVERDLSKSPLFQVAFLYQTATEQGAESHDLGNGTTLRALDDPLAVHTQTSKFDLALVVWDRGDRLDVSFEYASDLFDGETIDRLLERYEVLLTSALDDPACPLRELALLTPDEERLLARWNATAAELRTDVCVDQLFEEAADRHPDRLAVACEGEELTYRELDERANRLAHHLRARGVGPDVPVAIATERAPEMLVGILGTLKAGGCYMPIDLAYPADRLAFQFADGGVPVVLTRAGVEQALPPETETSRRLRLDTEWERIAGEPATRPPRVSGPRDLSYVIYTSGSTGEPKGVALEHIGLVNLLSWHRRTYDVTPDDRAAHLAGLAFDASVWELWPYLTAGASLHLCPDDVRLSPRRLTRWMVERGITQSFVPTPLAEAMVREELPETMPLQVVCTGGDKFRRAPDRPLPFRLVNHYGPTENTVVATATPIEVVLDGDPHEEPPAPPIGKPIDNVRAYVLDQARQRVPIGVAGELYIGGASLARGYFGRPDLTAERFVESALDPGHRLYRTGDLVRWRPDGELEFLGRLDGQVKVRGFRIELGEIEAQLARAAAVEDCAVVVRRDERGEGVLIGYAVAADGATPTSEALRTHLRDALPEYMVPATIVLLDELPLSPNGKVDRAALPEVDLAGAAEYVDPAGELETTIAGVWCDLLGIERVGATANFFEVGGHSLLLAQVHARLTDELGADVSMVELFRYPTISSLASHLAAHEVGDGAETVEASRDRGAKRRAAMRTRRRAR